MRALTHVGKNFTSSSGREEIENKQTFEQSDLTLCICCYGEEDPDEWLKYGAIQTGKPNNNAMQMDPPITLGNGTILAMGLCPG